MKLFERILGMRIRPRRRNPVTHQFEGAESYYFPTPKEARATSATCGNGSDEVKALKYNQNKNRDETPKPEPLPQTHTATCGTNLSSNLVRKKEEREHAPTSSDVQSAGRTEISSGTEVAARRQTKRGFAPLPKDWQPKDAPTTKLGKRELEKMKNWALANDIRRKDWDAQWRNWKIKAVEFMERDRARDDPSRVMYT